MPIGVKKMTQLTTIMTAFSIWSSISTSGPFPLLTVSKAVPKISDATMRGRTSKLTAASNMFFGINVSSMSTMVIVSLD